MQVATLNLTLDNVQRNFRYRKGTADEAVIVQVLKNTSYNFAALRRGRELVQFYGRLVQAGKTSLIVDGAADIGAAAVYFARAFPKARVVAIEPDQSNFELLEANAANLPIECMHVAVSANGARPGNGSANGHRNAGANSVADVTINEIYERNAADTLPFIVKIDVEAAGGALFSRNTEWVGRTPVIIAALHDCLIPGTANSRAFVERIASFNRDFVYLHDLVFSINRETWASS